jgi:hypothetical protein
VTSVDLSFNPRPRVEVLRFGSGGYCCVVDDILRFPEEWVAYAVARRAEFVSAAASGYPGISLAIDTGAGYAMREFFAFHMRRYFDARRLVQMICRYSMVTLAPAQLSPGQWICHQDPPLGDPRLTRQASVLYLFHDETLGGTSFYESTRPFAETSQLLADSAAMDARQFTERYGIQPSYLCDSNAYFRRAATVPARWNRAVFYSGALLHTGQIDAPERLTADPATGRLTVNVFFSSRPNMSAADQGRIST